MRAIWSLLAALLAATLVAQPTDYTLDTGDVIAVVVLRHEQFSGEYTVPLTGMWCSLAWGACKCVGRPCRGLPTRCASG